MSPGRTVGIASSQDKGFPRMRQRKWRPGKVITRQPISGIAACNQFAHAA
jgi:hypothetical protein